MVKINCAKKAKRIPFKADRAAEGNNRAVTDYEERQELPAGRRNETKALKSVAREEAGAEAA